ncbi:hypothetical protein BCR35DRAFT_350758 [Leucosporidium creatinivorum]|uniref:Uncharacterized protein n=1 Tax=Leucosporidium creatinivorum TaxID=106004 RepID=A0A1Y2FXU6_9BASI|nr:hypothetical protein BCR35DRAFT_350758 [Leucosporidium creatinivorum]
MSEPPPASFVPLSLSDTLSRPQSQRVLHRTTNVPRPASARPSHSHSNSLSSLQAARDAKLAAVAMAASLGITAPAEEDDNDEPDASTLETPRPRPPLRGISSSSSTRGEDEQELAKLRRQVASLQKEKSELAMRAERAERERDKLAKAAAGGAGAGNKALDAKQFEELEQSFADQERLLSGYQAQSEKDQAEREALKRQMRRLTDFLAKTLGLDWETSLFGSPLSSITSSASSAALSSPALRSKLGGRQSLLATPNGGLPLRRRISDSLEESSTEERDSADQEEGEEGTPTQPESLLTPQALRSHLDAVQTLLRSMEQRIIEREVELQEVEKRAREEARKARERSDELEELVRRLREERV